MFGAVWRWPAEDEPIVDAWARKWLAQDWPFEAVR